MHEFETSLVKHTNSVLFSGDGGYGWCVCVSPLLLFWWHCDWDQEDSRGSSPLQWVSSYFLSLYLQFFTCPFWCSHTSHSSAAGERLFNNSADQILTDTSSPLLAIQSFHPESDSSSGSGEQIVSDTVLSSAQYTIKPVFSSLMETWASLHKGEFEFMQFNTFHTQTQFAEFTIVVSFSFSNAAHLTWARKWSEHHDTGWYTAGKLTQIL